MSKYQALLDQHYANMMIAYEKYGAITPEKKRIAELEEERNQIMELDNEAPVRVAKLIISGAVTLIKESEAGDE